MAGDDETREILLKPDTPKPVAARPTVVDDELDPAVREAATDHVLRVVHPDRREAEVVGMAPADGGVLVGVKVHPRGYLSTAKYALVTVDADGRVVDAKACSGRELRRELEREEG